MAGARPVIVDLAARPLLPPDRGVLADLDWEPFAALWNANELGAAHDWLNERWSRLIRNSLLGTVDPEAQFLQALAFATLAYFFTQNRNQEGARLVLDDALVALARYRPSFLGVRVDPIVAGLAELQPLLAGLAAEDECPLMPFVYPRFEYSR
jgi:hypothetical protein